MARFETDVRDLAIPEPFQRLLGFINSRWNRHSSL
jgi:hypothetical protein